MKRIHLVRHGETDNPDGIVYGLRDFPLTKLGRKQAFTAGNYLRHKIESDPIVVSSSVHRAKETATRLLLGDVEVDHNLRESISMFDGGRVPEFVKEPRNWKRLTKPSGPSWGEPYGETYTRMWEAFTRACTLRTDDVVLVSHQLPIWILRLGLEGRPWVHDPSTRQCGHASVTSISIERGRISKINYWENPVHE